MAEQQDLGKTTTGLKPNIGGLLAYALGWLSGLVLYLIEKENKFIRFHALQSLIFFGGLMVFGVVMGILCAILGAIRLGALVPVIMIVTQLVWLASMGVWIFMMYKAYKGEKITLPVVGEIAEKNS